MTPRHLLSIIALLTALFAGACGGGASSQPDCVVDGVSVAQGHKVPSDECGGCICDNGQVTCTQEGCIPMSTYELEESEEGWGVSEYYCCCKSGCPPGSAGCLSACLVFGGACSDTASDLRQACEGSNPADGCACAPDNESTVAP